MIYISSAVQAFILSKALILFLVLTSLYFLSWRIKPNMWTYEMSGGKIGKPSLNYIAYLFLFYGTLTGCLVYFDNELSQLELHINQTSVFVINLLILGLYCLLHLFIISYIIYIRLQPAIFDLKSVKNNHNLGFHVKLAFLTFVYGSLFCFIASMLLNLSY